MIHLKIIESPDIIVCTDFIFYKNLITIGSSHCDICIDDMKLSPHHLSIEINSENKLIIDPAKKIKNFLVNGKLTTQKIYLLNNQPVKIGSTTFMVTHFEFESEDDIKTIRDKKLIELSEKEDPKWKLLENIRSNLE